MNIPPYTPIYFFYFQYVFMYNCKYGYTYIQIAVYKYDCQFRVQSKLTILLTNVIGNPIFTVLQLRFGTLNQN
jgi:hypothetical protein